MNEFEKNFEPQDPMAEIQATLGLMHATGAMDEEGPFVEDLMNRIQRKLLAPEDALRQLRKKMQGRQDYH